MALSEAKLKFWAENRYNVCISGRHGVGKTSQVFDLFNELYGKLGEDWLYFSAATMDPWVDFIGVPKERVAEDGTPYLDLVRPEIFARDRVKAIFLDEYNRSPKKIRNAVMELIQFHSINGHKFNTLEVVWTAINPPQESDDDDMNYDVDELDPAQLDRFHIFVEVPYTVSKPYFKKKFGDNDGGAATEWWKSLPVKVRDVVSPRRLDYAIDCYQKGGDVRDVLPKQANTSQLLFMLSEGSIRDNLKELKSNNDVEAVKKKLAEANFYNLAINVILKSKAYTKYFIPKCPEEKIAALFGQLSYQKLDKMLESLNKSEEMFHVVTEIYTSGGLNRDLTRKLNDWRVTNFSHLMDKEQIIADFVETLSVVTSDMYTETTYYRLQNVNELADEFFKLPKGSEITETHARTFYSYMLVAIARSQEPTYRKFKTKWFNALKKMNSMHSFDKIVKSSKMQVPQHIIDQALEHYSRYEGQTLDGSILK